MAKGRPLKKRQDVDRGVEEFPDLSEAVGFQGGSPLKPADERLFQAFQANLLSLVSHELRTPLTGILNALGLLQEISEDAEADLSREELLHMAQKNAHRLNQTLASLLDLANIESGSFHLRLREADLHRLLIRKLRENKVVLGNLDVEIKRKDSRVHPVPVLVDPQRFGRVVDLCIQVLTNWVTPGSKILCEAQPFSIEIQFPIEGSKVSDWNKMWSQALAGFQGGVVSPISAFGATVQSEDEFLSRSQEGLGSEFLLIHETMRRHQGEFRQELKKNQVKFVLELPRLSTLDTIRAVLAARVYETSTELGSLALGLVRIPHGVDEDEFRAEIRKALFRATDAAYLLSEERQIAIVLNDCKPEDAPRLLKRISESMDRELEYGLVTCPEEGSDPDLLIELAQKRLTK